jgi:hypothetical protein
MIKIIEKIKDRILKKMNLKTENKKYNDFVNDFLKKYSDPVYIDELKTRKIEYLKNLLSECKNNKSR